MLPTVDDIVKKMWQEIITDVLELVVPINVESFSELHDYVDANCYGGFCDDDGITDVLIAHFGGRDEHEGMPQQVIDFMNECQGKVDAWLREGELPEAVGELETDQNFTAVDFGDILRDYKVIKRALDLIRSLRDATPEQLREIAQNAYVNANY